MKHRAEASVVHERAGVYFKPFLTIAARADATKYFYSCGQNNYAL